MLREILLGLGIIGFMILVVIVALLPLVCTLVLGIYIASSLGLTGIMFFVWWSFVILFYLILMGLLGLL